MNKTLKIIGLINAGASNLGVSGGDRIFIELLKRFLKKDHKISVYTWKELFEVMQQHELKDVQYIIFKTNYKGLGFPFLYLARTIHACVYALTKTNENNVNNTIIYSSSDFWPDSLPGFILKKRFKNVKWVASFYLFAPNPFSYSDSYYRGGIAPFNLRNLLYYITQRIIYWLIKWNADFIIVASQLDKNIFIKDGVSPSKIIPIYGGVDLKEISKYSTQQIKYDGCFVGRLHPQKGPIELVKIWDLVSKNKKNAKLSIIGNGPLEKEIQDLIKKRGLEKNIEMFGYVDGEKKYKILKSSKVFLHTPVADTGGMAAAEGMACGLPVVGFDLPGYKFCYPRGMLKAPIGDLEQFAKLVLNLLQNKELYYKVKKDALEFVQEFDWDKRAEGILDEMEKLFT